MKTKRFLAAFISILIVFSCLSAVSAAPVGLTPLAESERRYSRSLLVSEFGESSNMVKAYDDIADAVKNASSSVNIASYKITIADFMTNYRFMYAITGDYPEYFWLNNSYSYLPSGDYVSKVYFNYKDEITDIEGKRSYFDYFTNEILYGINDSMSDYTKEKIIHDRLAQRATYDYDVLSNSSLNPHAYSAYGAIVNNLCVCDGYAKAFQYLLAEAGVWSYRVTGLGDGGSHAWTMIRLDEDYYNVDLTWDDAGDGGYYGYFNITDELMDLDHIVQWPSVLPECTNSAENYFVKNGAYLTSFNAIAVGRVLKDNALTASLYIAPDNTVDDFVNWAKSNIRAIATAAGVTGTFSYGMSYSGRNVHLYIIISGYGSLSGEVVSYGNEADDVTVELKSGSKTYTQTISGKSGTRYIFGSIPVGTYALTATKNGQALYTKDVTVTATKTQVNNITIMLKYDVNGDGIVDIKDLVRTRTCLVRGLDDIYGEAMGKGEGYIFTASDLVTMRRLALES